MTELHRREDRHEHQGDGRCDHEASGLSLVNDSPISLSLAKKAIGQRIVSQGVTQMSIQGSSRRHDLL